MKALEISIDGVIVGIFVPPAYGGHVHVALRNGPQNSILANFHDLDLPEVREGQRISFRMIESPVDADAEPQIIRPNKA